MSSLETAAPRPEAGGARDIRVHPLPCGPQGSAFPLALMLPAVLLVVCVTFLPILQAISLSFHDTTYLKIGGFVGLRHFRAFFLDPLGRQNLLNSLIFTFGSLAV